MRFFYLKNMEIKALYEIYKISQLVDTDTRKIRENSIFFALKGENFNGNKFAEKALQLGAKFAIIDEKKYQTKENIILVDDVLETLQALANYHRKKLSIPIIALTGSNGKTTTKELIHIVLSKQYKAIATKGNLNNHIGVPLTLLSILPEHEIAIVEMGANHQKEIEFLCSICEPDYGYITNFGKAHLEGFGGIEGVIKGKCELYTYLKNSRKIAFINTNDSIQLEKSEGIKQIPLNNNEIAFVDANPFVTISVKGKIIKSNLIGAYNYSNILAAISIGEYFNVEDSAIEKAIKNYTPDNNRSQVIEKENHKIILDAYNANPSSMQVALENFAKLAHEEQLVILGDMFELGSESFKEHQAIADLTNSLNFKEIYFVGKHFYQVNTNGKKFKTFDELKNFLIENPITQKSILVKGSRGMQLERLLELIN